MEFYEDGDAMALMTVKQASEQLNISPATIYALVAEGRIRSHRFGLKRGTIRISDEALEAYCRAARSGCSEIESEKQRCPAARRYRETPPKEMDGPDPVARESLAIREKTQPDVWSTFNTKSLLGGALLEQARSASNGVDAATFARAAGLYRDAEPLLLAGYEGMKNQEAKIPAQGKIRLTEAVERLIELYTATNKPAEVKRLQAERAKYPATSAESLKKN